MLVGHAAGLGLHAAILASIRPPHIVLRLHPHVIRNALTRFVHSCTLYGLLALQSRLLQLQLEIHQLLDKARVRIDDRSPLPANVQGRLQGNLMLQHQVSADAGSAPRHAGPTMDKDFATFGQCISDKKRSIHEMASKILPRHIVHLEHLVFEAAFK